MSHPLTDRPGVVLQDNLNNWLNWGRLVKDWAAGRKAPPSSIAELKAQALDANVEMTIPDTYKKVLSTSYDPEVLVLPIPAMATIEAGEKWMQEIAKQPVGQRGYPLPDFYQLAFGNMQQVDFSEGELVDFNARRIGEYALNPCG